MPKDPGPQTWQADFLDRSPMLAPLRFAGAHLRGAAWPTLEALQPVHPIATVSGLTLRFVPQGAKPASFEEQYEPRIHLRGEVQTRTENWHDLFNALAWLAFPRAKATITDRHYHAALTQAAGQNRHPARHALTLFDESGVAVACADPELTQLLRDFQWQELFWQRREEVQRSMKFFVFGHSLYEKALTPYLGLTGHGLVLAVEEGFFAAASEQQQAELDRLLATRLGDPASLRYTPVPLLGVPGWWDANQAADFYDNTAYFRAKPANR
ncbi:MAG: DUF3025 domain-containing protein [Betaproteobacteria bacterium]|nr:MAG: DUF3025 domain-containing protein [Betaproteobacteria bacterium]